MNLRRTRIRASLALLGFAAAGVGISGCGVTSINDLKDRLFGGTSSVTLQIQSIQLRSDHALGADPTGPAAVSTNSVIRFRAIGTFTVNGTLSTETNDVSGGVVWTSTDPSLLFPAADGRALASSSTGTVTITATSPAIGTIPALNSNPITVTIQ